MNIAFIETFLTVARTRTITEAANNLYLSQSTVSGRLQQLEDELGVILIERKKGSRGVELTDKGKAFISLAERWMMLSKEINYFSQHTSEIFLSIACPDTLNAHLFPPFYKKMLASEPNLKLRICSPNAASIYKMIDNYDVDVGFVYFTSRYDNVVTKPIMSEKMVILCSALSGWPNRSLAPGELDPTYLVNLRWSAEIEQWCDTHWNPSIRSFVKLETISLLGDFIDNPNCWTICPVSVAKSLMYHRKNIEIHECTEEIPERICYMLTRRNPGQRLNEAINMFERYLKDFLKTQKDIIILP